ncbi:hypothetical protein NHX12_021141 [Muraenolepis orangiensis]|uniref:Gap junction protein n=1 Tax=Muraenolepis orangiensis TaxID=630683 RepID=A0A9Q0IUR5_9TELE|nr:hypothetical protein NHX12_021141 [Muraenolepis orangiensis]
MSGAGACEVIFISLSHSTTLIGKVWLIVMVFLRVLILLLAGYPLYRDEQERFVCNTIQPGCANVCYDLFAPVSLFRFWLVQLVALSLPYLVFLVYVVHRVSYGLVSSSSATPPPPPPPPLPLPLPPPPPPPPQEAGRAGKAQRGGGGGGGGGGNMAPWRRCFAGAYLLQLVFRILLEVCFGAAHYYLFGFAIPSRFLCQQQPCTTQVDCYVSRPTEKSVMLCFMLAAAALSLGLNTLDVVWAVRRSVRQSGRRRRRRMVMMAEKLYEEERYYLGCSDGGREENTIDAVSLAGGASRPGSFRKRGASKPPSVCGSGVGDRSSSPGTPVTLTPGAPHGPPNANGGHGGNGEVRAEGSPHSSHTALCLEPPATPRSIRVNKRGRLKPPPPPRRDHTSPPPPPPLVGVGGVPKATAVGHRKGGLCAQAGLAGGHDDGQTERSEWV